MKLFVYGSLMRGGRLNHIMEFATYDGPAETAERFSLKCNGYYPYLTRGNTSTVKGEVYLIDEILLSRLQRIEAEYKLVDVTLQGGETAKAFLCEHPSDGLYLIPSGDFKNDPAYSW